MKSHNMIVVFMQIKATILLSMMVVFYTWVCVNIDQTVTPHSFHTGQSCFHELLQTVKLFI